jgi:hypothetical protein
MAKPKASPTAQPLTDKVGKRTRQGNGTRSRPSHGRKKRRGQGK